MVTYSTLPFDVIHHICSTVWASLGNKPLSALSLVDRRTRTACIPFLFTDVAYIRQWGESGLPWNGFGPCIDALLANEAIRAAIRKLHFRPYVATRLIAASPIPNAFFTLLFSIPNLSEMIFCPQFEYLAQVKEEFYAIEDVLPELDPKLLLMLEALTLPSPEWMFVAEYCPRLKSLEVLSRTQNPWHAYDELDIDIVRLGKTHPDLTKLHCRVTGIRTHVHEIATNLPKIEDLGLYGFFVESWDGETNPKGIMSHLRALNTFKHLRSLSLPEASDLGIGYNPPYCGNAYYPGLRESLQKQREKVLNRLMQGITTEVIMQKGSTLCEVVIGRRGYTQRVWKKGEKGELYESKEASAVI